MFDLALKGGSQTVVLTKIFLRTQTLSSAEVGQLLQLLRRDAFVFIHFQTLQHHFLDLIGQLGFQLTPPDRN